jgi:hypothetical protein
MTAGIGTVDDLGKINSIPYKNLCFCEPSKNEYLSDYPHPGQEGKSIQRLFPHKVIQNRLLRYFSVTSAPVCICQILLPVDGEHSLESS